MRECAQHRAGSGLRPSPGSTSHLSLAPLPSGTQPGLVLGTSGSYSPPTTTLAPPAGQTVILGQSNEHAVPKGSSGVLEPGRRALAKLGVRGPWDTEV